MTTTRSAGRPASNRPPPASRAAAMAPRASQAARGRQARPASGCARGLPGDPHQVRDVVVHGLPDDAPVEQVGDGREARSVRAAMILPAVTGPMPGSDSRAAWSAALRSMRSSPWPLLPRPRSSQVPAPPPWCHLRAAGQGSASCPPPPGPRGAHSHRRRRWRPPPGRRGAGGGVQAAARRRRRPRRARAPVASPGRPSAAEGADRGHFPGTVEPHRHRLIDATARATRSRGQRGARGRGSRARRLLPPRQGPPRRAPTPWRGVPVRQDVAGAAWRRSGGAAPAVLAENVRQRGRASFTRSLLAAVGRRGAWMPADRAGRSAGPARPTGLSRSATLPGHAYAPLTFDLAATLRAPSAARQGAPSRSRRGPARAMARYPCRIPAQLPRRASRRGRTSVASRRIVSWS